MTDPLSWLRQAITERMELARKALPGPWHLDRDPLRGIRVTDEAGLVVTWTPEYYKRGDNDALHIAANDPRDVIARCEGELGILDEHEREYYGCGTCIEPGSAADYDPQTWPCKTVRLLASGYRFHPGYAEAGWGPVPERA